MFPDSGVTYVPDRTLDALEDATPYAEHHRIIRAAGQSDSAAAMAAELNRIVQEILDAP
jgi:hypothetical protein